MKTVIVAFAVLLGLAATPVLAQQGWGGNPSINDLRLIMNYDF